MGKIASSLIVVLSYICFSVLNIVIHRELKLIKKVVRTIIVLALLALLGFVLFWAWLIAIYPSHLTGGG